LYVQGRFSEAIKEYMRVQNIDKVGKTLCAGSAYATLGTIYAALAASNDKESTQNWQLASRFNRAFAGAVMCLNGDCKESKYIWGEVDPSP
jgi:hypothetical protein